MQLGKGSRPLQQVGGSPVFTMQPSLLTKGRVNDVWMVAQFLLLGS